MAILDPMLAPGGHLTVGRPREIAERALPADGDDAREFGISSAYACRLFRRFDAASPYRYLLQQRMSLAADLLTHDRLLVKQVAAHLGFADQYQFSRAFKRVSGISPGRLLGR